MSKLLNYLYRITNKNLFGFMGLIFIIIILVIVFVSGIIQLIKLGIKSAVGSIKINIRDLSTRKKWVKECFYELAHGVVQERCRKQERLIYTQRGYYRSTYLDEVDREVLHYQNICCDNERFNEDFCRFVAGYSNVRRKDLIKLIWAYMSNKDRTDEMRKNSFINSAQSISPEEFFEVRARQNGDIVGVYIIHNEDTDQYYVGQAKRVFFRVNQHFTGHGNGDIYADYVYGNSFKIQMLKLSESGYDDLDKLERDMIAKYNAFGLGYNKTSGNY